MADKSPPSNLSRAAFLQGGWRKDKALIRPPWSKDESEFVATCNSSCQACADACPEKIIIIGRGKYPHIDFSQGECTFCEQCLDACDYSALDKHGAREPWTHKAVIKLDQCITQQSVVCRSCSENCDVAAIKFHPTVGGVSAPELTSDLCNGCGACMSVCPSNAIFINALDDVDQGKKDKKGL